MVTTGIDILEIKRIQACMENPRFMTRVFSAMERELFAQKRNHPQTVAAHFCAKEAFSKALGTGIRGFSLDEVSLARDSLGKPYFVFTGRAKELAEGSGYQFSVSITHTKEYAAAVVVGERQDSL